MSPITLPGLDDGGMTGMTFGGVRDFLRVDKDEIRNGQFCFSSGEAIHAVGRAARNGTRGKRPQIPQRSDSGYFSGGMG